MERPQPEPTDRRLIGEPTTCSSCGATAVIDRFDLVRETQHERCPECDTRWRTPFAELSQLH